MFGAGSLLALSGGVVGRLIADRFHDTGDGRPRDLATGDPVRLIIRTLPAGREAWDRACHEELAAGGGVRGLIDFGPVGTSQCFEARAAPEAGEPAPVDATFVRVAEDVVQAAVATTRGTRVVRLPLAAGRDGRDAARAIARGLRLAGFVPARCDVGNWDEIARLVSHRHVAVVVYSETPSSLVRSWMRILASGSPRGHLVVRLERAARRAPAAAANRVRERMPEWPVAAGARAANGHPDRRFERAAALDRRGRHAGAERWYRSAMESARRRDDDRGRAAACLRLVEMRSGRGQWGEAGRLIRDTLASVEDAPAQAELVAAHCRVLTAQLELGEADGRLSAWAAAGDGQAEDYRGPLQSAEAELRFWQGRLDECSAVASGLADGTSRILLQGLIAWVRRDTTALRAMSAAADEPGADEVTWLRPLLSLLALALSGDERGVTEQAAALGSAVGARGHPRLIALSAVLTAEALVDVGRSGDAREVLRALVTTSGGWPPLDDRLFDWVDAAIDGDARHAESARAELVGAGVGLVRVWRWARPDMYLMHAIPRVLELVHEAEDEQAALVAVCGWLRRECGAEGAAFLDGNRQVIAAEGWTSADRARAGEWRGVGDDPATVDLSGGQVACMASARYAGSAVGIVVVRGRSERVSALSEAARTAASLAAPALGARIAALSAARAAPLATPEILGRSPAIVSLRAAIARIATTPFAVLVEGESGTGKELVARAVHRLSPRRDRRFAAVNCAALTDELVEAELFGHARGAFTGAVGPRTGIFEDAHGGSVFLDEVGELSIRAQAKLLRVLQEREVRRVGENAARPIDVRVIAATNRPLAAAVAGGLFREDLLFRLAVVRIRLPPLRERLEDVPILASTCWRALAAEAGKRAVLGPDAVARLTRHHWPGNVRELHNVIAALAVAAPSRGRVRARDVDQVLAGSEAAGEPAQPLHRLREDCERMAVAGALARHGGRRAAAAHELGLTRQGLTKAMRRLGLTPVRPASGVA